MADIEMVTPGTPIKCVFCGGESIAGKIFAAHIASDCNGVLRAPSIYQQAAEAYHAFRATTPGTTAEEEAYARWVQLGDMISRLDRAIIRASWRDDARRQGK